MPTLIDFDSPYSVGHAELDAQNQQFYALCKRAENCVNAGTGLAHLHQALNALSDSAREHFAFEESLLKECNYPLLADQERDHGHFMERIRLFLAMPNANIAQSYRITDFALDWWHHHLMVSDRKYRGAIRSRITLDRPCSARSSPGG